MPMPLRLDISVFARTASVLGLLGTCMAWPAQANVPCDMAEPGMVQIGTMPSGSNNGQIALCGWAYGTGPGSEGQTAEDIARSYNPGRDIEGERLQSDVNALGQQILQQYGGTYGAGAANAGATQAVPAAAPASGRPLGWDYHENQRAGSPAGLNCVVSFIDRARNSISLVGPVASDSKAYMTFVGPSIPRPASPTSVQAELLQTGDSAPAAVQVQNYTDPATGLGGIVFGIPSPKALADSMQDTIRFQISLAGAPVFDATWNHGVAAREHFRRCMGV